MENKEKLSYEEFKQKIEAFARETFPEESELSFTEVRTFNNKYEGLILKKPDSGRTNAAPVINVTRMYEAYEKGTALEKILKEAEEVYRTAIENADNVVNSLDYSKAKENIFYQLVNTEKNQSRLENVPHREIENLSLIYRWKIGVEPEGAIKSAVVSDALARVLNLNEEQLYQLAKENNERLMPTEVMSLFDTVKEMVGDDLMPLPNPDERMWVITNKYKVNGASAIFNEEKMAEIADMVEENLYILPSSIHECLLVPSEGKDIEVLTEMVRSVNEEQVAPEEQLSDEVYVFDRKTRKISLAKDYEEKERETEPETMMRPRRTR